MRRNSDLPEPVAPMTRPCGPMPCWADSLMSRWTTEPPSPSADRHPQPVAGGPLPPGAVGVEGCTSPRPSSSMKSASPRDLRAGCSSTAPLTVCSGVSRRANASAVARSSTGRPGPDRLLAQPQRRDREPALVGRLGRPRTAAAAGSRPRARPSAPGRSSTVTPCRPSGRYDVVAGRQARRRRSRAACAAWPAARRRRTAAARSGRRGSSAARSSSDGGHHPHRADGVGLLGALARAAAT